MGEDHVVGCHERLCLRIPCFTAPKGTRAARWRVNPRPVSANRYNIRLIKCYPVLNSVPKISEAYVCIVAEILPDEQRSTKFSPKCSIYI